MPMDVTWDTLTPPEPQWIQCLEILSTVEVHGTSYGIILNCEPETRRLGHFVFNHREVSGRRWYEGEESNWLHSKSQRKIYIV